MRPLALLLAAALPAPAAAAPPAQATIPSIGRDGVLEWRADGIRRVYLRAINGRWYRADLSGNCSPLRYVNGIGFRTSAFGNLDNMGAILVENRSCPIASLVESPAPPKRRKRP